LVFLVCLVVQNLTVERLDTIAFRNIIVRMTSPDPTPASADPHLADAIARAEEGIVMLRRLAALGMEMAEEVREHHKMADLHPEPRHDLRKGFDLMARSVRLTLSLIRRFDADLVAMRKGEPIKVSPARGVKPVGPSSQLPVLGPEGVRVRDAVRTAINAKHGEWDGAMDALDEMHERLIEYETEARFHSKSFRECVEAICADLGVKLDWNTWSDDTGFAAPAGKPNVKWHMLWSHDPKRAERRRQREAEQPPASPRPNTSTVIPDGGSAATDAPGPGYAPSG
jgi:hypothetical protein